MRKKSEHLYLQLAETLMSQIREGTYADGSLLPSERELCEQYHLSRTTVRQALQVLNQKGYTKSSRGKATVALQPQIRQELNSIYSFDEDMRKLGRTPETRILDFLEVKASGKIATALSVPEGTPVYRIMRLRLADGEPMLLETNYLPCARFPGITLQEVEGHSLYQMLNAQHGLNITVAEETFEPILMRSMEASLFGTAPHTLGMLIERIAYEDGVAVELSKSVSPSSKFKPHVVLKR